MKIQVAAPLSMGLRTATLFATYAQAGVPNVTWYRLWENEPAAASSLALTDATTDIAGVNHLKQFRSPLFASAVSTDAAARAESSLAVQDQGSGQYLGNAVVPRAVKSVCLEAWVKPNTASETYHFVAHNSDTANNDWGIARQGGQPSVPGGDDDYDGRLEL